MESKKIEDLMKQAEDLMKQGEELLAKPLGFDFELSSTEEYLSLKIMQKIKKSLSENDLDITITPIMYNPENFMPTLGVLIKTENGFNKKYTISIAEHLNDLG